MYVDACAGTSGNAFDIRRTAVAMSNDRTELAFTLRVCDADALTSITTQQLAWQTDVKGGPSHTFWVRRDPPTGRLAVYRDTSSEQVPSSLVGFSDPQPAPGVDQLVVIVPVSAVGLPPECNPAQGAHCMRIAFTSYDGAQIARDRMPDGGVDDPVWPSACRPDIDPAAAGHVRLTTTSTSAAEVVEDRLRRAGYRATAHADAPHVEIAVGASAQVREALAHWDEVVEIAPVSGRRLAAVESGDPAYDRQWYLPRIGMPGAWETTRGSGLGIAIVDNGVATDRPDLAGRVQAGWDAMTGTALPAGTHSDLGGHGTAVAALAAGDGDDGTGMAGVDWTASVHPVRVFDHEGCFVSENAYLEALDWIAAGADKGTIQVANFSLGGSAIPGEAERITRIVDNGAVVVAAMGNDGNHVASYPAALDEVVAVGATGGPDDALAAYSNIGRHVDVVAPGGRLDGNASTAVLTLGDPVAVGEPAPYLTVLSGTSFSAPLVSGLAALYLAEHRGATPGDVARALITTAEDLGEGLAGFDIGYGYGMVDAARMLAHAPGQTLARVAGGDRYETAVLASRRAFPDPDLVDVVLLATGENYPDALAGGPLAAREHAPVLLTPSDQLHGATRSELARLSPDRVILLGGTGALSPAVEAALARDYTVERAAGPDRYATAATIALGDPTGGTWRAWNSADVVYLATGQNFPDALPGGAAAAAFDAPLLLTARDSLPAATEEALWLLQPSRVVVLGGTSAVGQAVVDRLAHLGIRVDRAAGRTRYETAIAALCPVATLCQDDTRVAVVATGESFADALGGSAAAAALRAPLVLVPGRQDVPDVVAREVADLGPEHVVLLGGTVAITDAVEDRVRQLAVR